MRDPNPILKQGQIVKISLNGLSYSSEGFLTLSHDILKKKMRVYQFIDLVTYPSCNDFHGETSAVEQGQLAVVMDYVGRPCQVKRDPVWFKYDVYEVLINGNVRQMFRQNLIPVLTGSNT